MRLLIRHLILLVSCAFLFPGSTAGQLPQCGCPDLLETTLETDLCTVTDSGFCVVCPGAPMTFTIEEAAELPFGGIVQWFTDTDPDFDPTNGEGSLAYEHLINPVFCNIATQVRINEFQPIPAAGDDNLTDFSTGEWVELIGPAGLDIGCYVLTDGDWTIEIPEGTTIPLNGLFVIGFANYGPVDLDVGTCNCSQSADPNETLVLDNDGEYLALWNGVSYVNAIRYGNPILANTPPFGSHVNLGALATSGQGTCSASVPITFPVFQVIPAMPILEHSYEREPDFNGSWVVERCGSRGECNADPESALPYVWNTFMPNTVCNDTVYFKAIVTPSPGNCPDWPNNAAAGPFAVYVSCPTTSFTDTLCTTDSLVVNGETYDVDRPFGLDTLPSSLGCDSLLIIDLAFHPAVSMTLDTDTIICAGDSAYLTFHLTGTPPFAFTLQANGANDIPFTTDQSTLQIGVRPDSTTIYTAYGLSDAPGCPGEILGSSVVTVFEPEGTMSLSTPDICLGDTADLQFNLLGTGPFDLLYSAGVDTINVSVNGTSNLPVSPPDTTLYTFLGATDSLGCPVTLSGQDLLLVNRAPTITGVRINCTPDELFYSVELEISGGDSSSYQINGASGSFTDTVWTSDLIPSPGNYTLILDDGNQCAPDTVTGFVDCSCTITAGELFPDTLDLCPGESSNATYQTMPVLEPGDTLLFYLYSDLLDPLGSTLITSNQPIFTYQPGWPLNQPIYLSAVAGDPLNGQVDPADPCRIISNPVTLFFRANPTVQYDLPPSLCAEDCFDFTAQVNGLGSTILNLTWGDPQNPVPLSLMSMDGNYTSTLCGDVFPGDLSFTLLAVQDSFCTNIVQETTVIPHPQPPVISYTDILCPGDSLLLYGTWYNSTNLTDTFTLDNPVPFACDTIIEIALRLQSPADSLIERTLCSGSTLTAGGQVFDENFPTGQVILEGGNWLGCDSIITVDLTFTTVVETTIDTMICPGDTIWVNNQPYTVGTPSGVEVITGGSTLGCDSSILVDLTFFPTLNLELSGDTTICPGDSAWLTILGSPGNYDLSLSLAGGPEQFFSNIATGIPFTYLPSGPGTITLSSASTTGNPCPVNLVGGAAIGFEQVNAPIVISSDFNGSAIRCAGESDGSLTVSPQGGSPPYSIFWSTGDTGPVLNGLGAGLYAVTVTSNRGCTFRDSLSLQEPLPLTINASTFADPCGPATTLLEAISGGTGPWSWSIDGSVWNPVSTPPQSIPGLPPGPILLSVQDINGCDVDTTLIIPPDGLGISVAAAPDTALLIGQSVTLSYSTAANVISAIWSPGGSLSCTSCPDPVATPTEPTTYLLTIQDDRGCIATTSVLVDLLPDRRFLYIPTAFSPNNDGINDLFIPFGDEQTLVIDQAAVYDRWGNALWERQDIAVNSIADGWDGTYRGKVLDPGVYVYVFVVRHQGTQKVRTYKGEVVLMR